MITSGNVNLGANFYVPCENCDLKELASHVYISVSSKNELSSNDTGPMRICELKTPNFWDLFEDLQGLSNLALVVPVVGSMSEWSRYRDSLSPLILDFDAQISDAWVERYQSLDPVAVLIQPGFSYLVDVPILIREEHATAEFVRFAHKISTNKTPYSNCLIEPLQPHNHDLEPEIYNKFHMDKLKYEMYDQAIELAISDIRSRGNLSIIVVGPGEGQLLKSVLRYCTTEDQIVAVEKNPNCYPILEQIKGYDLIKGDVRHHSTFDYDLVVSELLGSMACNEACPEILGGFSSSKTVFIPQSYQSSAVAVFSKLFDSASFNKPLLAYPAHQVVLSAPLPLFQFEHPTADFERTKRIELHIDKEERPNALLVYFDAVLYGPYSITTSLDSLRRSTSWFPIYFPMEKSSFVEVTRHSSSDKLWYSWATESTTHNEDGSIHIRL